MEYYKNCIVTFNDIPNMVTIGNSFKKLKNYISEFYKKKDTSFYSVLGESTWMKSISLLLKLSKKIVNGLKQGKSVFVHCSDGWDRTSQVFNLFWLNCTLIIRCLLLRNFWWTLTIGPLKALCSSLIKNSLKLAIYLRRDRGYSSKIKVVRALFSFNF